MVWLFVIDICIQLTIVSGFGYYGGSVGPESNEYNISLINNGKTYSPHVYGIHAPSHDTNIHNENSTNNWIEFEQTYNEETQIIISRTMNEWPNNTHIRPIANNIEIELINKYTLSFNVTGNAIHLSVHYGNESNTEDPNSCYQSSMLIFITPPRIIPSNYNKSSTKIFETDIEYKLTDGDYPAGQGVFSINETSNQHVNMIIIQRGAWVYGKIFINKSTGFKGIYGSGVISGRYFNYSERHDCLYWNECIAMIETNQSPFDIMGLTTVTPNFRLYDYIVGNIFYYRGIGWTGNNGGGILCRGSLLKDSFFKTDDDTIKFQQNVTTKNIVLWHGYNAAAFQFGAFGHTENEAVKNYNWNIIASENTIPNVYDAMNTKHKSNSILALPGAVNDKLSGPYEFHNFTVDGSVSNLILFSVSNDGYLRNVHFYNLLVRGQITNFNMLATNGTAIIQNITFHNFTINGQQIMDINNPQFKMHYTGNVDLNSIKFYR